MTVVEANRLACAALGFAPGELRGVKLDDLCPSQDVAALVHRMDGPNGDDPMVAILRTTLHGRDRRETPVEWRVSRVREATAERWVVVSRELVASVTPGDRAESFGLGLPGHDPLTGLPDRRLFERRLTRAFEESLRSESYRFAVCFIDLDGFKAVNDRFGHLIGDRALCEAGSPAGRLRSALRHGGSIRRRRVHGVSRRASRRIECGGGGPTDSRTTRNAAGDQRRRRTAGSQRWRRGAFGRLPRGRRFAAPGRSRDVSGEVARRGTGIRCLAPTPSPGERPTNENRPRANLPSVHASPARRTQQPLFPCAHEAARGQSGVAANGSMPRTLQAATAGRCARWPPRRASRPAPGKSAGPTL